jgi:PadR family transcriptional regulator PadR
MKDKYTEKILTDWESVFRQGLLTFWVFLALNTEEKTVAELKDSISELTQGTYQTSEQALYRSLRKYYDLELVDYREIETPGAPKRKLYVLSQIGKSVLKDFTKRNIALFTRDDVKALLEEKDNS